MSAEQTVRALADSAEKGALFQRLLSEIGRIVVQEIGTTLDPTHVGITLCALTSAQSELLRRTRLPLCLQQALAKQAAVQLQSFLAAPHAQGGE